MARCSIGWLTCNRGVLTRSQHNTVAAVHCSLALPTPSFVQRVNLKDYLAIYTEGSPDDQCQRFRVSTNDADDFEWSPNSNYIAVCDSCLCYSVFVYKAVDGSCLTQFHLAGRKGLGVRAVQWSPSSQFLAIGCYDNVRPCQETISGHLLGLGLETVPKLLAVDGCEWSNKHWHKHRCGTVHRL